jgi:peptidoglycan/xylan/chitin deacetylase (PgdA/CDA1 family)
VRAAHEAGHQFGNHSWDHSDLAKLDPQGVAEQLDRTSEVHEDLVGEPFEFFRPPYGSTSPAITQAAKDRGMREALWTVDSKDFQTESVEQVVAQASGMSDGGNVLLHDGHALTVEAVPYIINEYHERGLCFGKLGPSRQALSPAESPGLTYYVKAVAP